MSTPAAPGTGRFARLGARVDALSRRALWLWTFAPLAVVYLLSVDTDPRNMSPDPVAVVPSAWALAHHHTPVVASSLWTTLVPWAVPFGAHEVVTTRTPGLVALAAPLYALWPGAGPDDQLPASLEAAVVSAAAMATLALVLRQVASTRVALVAALLAGTATTTWAVSAGSLWPHGPDQLLLAVALLGAARGRAATTGLAFALLALVRPPVLIAAAVIGIVWSAATRRLRPVLVVGVLSCAGAALFLLYAARYWHHTSASGGAGAGGAVLSGATLHGYQGHFFDVGPAALLDLARKMGSALVAPNHGILPFSPFLLLLAPGLRRAWRHAPHWVRSSAVGGVLFYTIQMKSEVFDGGMKFWGYRYPLESLTLLAPLLVLAWVHWTALAVRRRALFAALAIVSATLEAIGVVAFYPPLAPHDWQFADLTSALSSSIAAVTLLLVGGTGAALTYLRMTRQPAGRRCSTSPAPTVSTAAPTSTCSRPSRSIPQARPTTAVPEVVCTDTSRPSVAQQAR